MPKMTERYAHCHAANCLCGQNDYMNGLGGQHWHWSHTKQMIERSLRPRKKVRSRNANSSLN